MGMCNYFLMLLPKFKMAARGQPQIFKVRNYLNFTITFPTIRRCAGVFFKGFAEIQNGRHGSTSVFLWAQKLEKIKGGIYSIFTITSSMLWRCAGYFFKVLLKFIMTAVDKINNLLWSQKLKN